MQKDKEQALKEHLAQLSANEREKLYKQAAQLRKRSRGKTSRNHGQEDEDGFIRPVKVESLDHWLLKLVTLEEARPARVPTEFGLVTGAGPHTCTVQMDGVAYECLLDGHRVAPGDTVGVATVGDQKLVASIGPRRTKLSRPDPDNGHLERVIIANIDAVVIVVSVVSPPLHPRLIDRYLIAIQHGGAQAMICVNKLDLAEGEERDAELSLLEPYRAIGVPIAACSTVTGEGMESFHEMVGGKLCAFVGHSGVGKSSLLNSLHPELGLLTGEVSEGYGRGTHTTTSSKLCDIGNGTRIIDTPGIRSFGLWDIQPDELRLYFPEFVARCRFNDCTHTHEPGCRVKEGVSAGTISSVRYDTYLRLLEGE